MHGENHIKKVFCNICMKIDPTEQNKGTNSASQMQFEW